MVRPIPSCTSRANSLQLHASYSHLGIVLNRVVVIPAVTIISRVCKPSSQFHCLLVVNFLQSHFATVKVSSVSFCTLDPKNKRIFAFINRKKKRNFCHVFQCHEQDVRLPCTNNIQSTIARDYLTCSVPYGIMFSAANLCPI